MSVSSDNGLSQPLEISPSEDWDAVISKVSQLVKSHMEALDASHDYLHIERVCGNAQLLYQNEKASFPEKSMRYPLIRLACLTHDLEDHKYAKEVDESEGAIARTLKSVGCSPEVIEAVKIISENVSFSHEVRNPGVVSAALAKYPELAIVQDADRLDALGAVGIARAFTYGGAKGRGLDDTIKHFGEKLEVLEMRMKTTTGKRVARERTQRIKQFKQWFLEEEGGTMAT